MEDLIKKFCSEKKCLKCTRLMARVEEAVKISGQSWRIEKTDSMDEMMKYPTWVFPMLVINGKVVARGYVPSVKVFDPNSETLNALASDYPSVKKTETPEEAAQAKVVVIAVHPPVVMETIEQIAGMVNDKTFVVSLAPKITIEKIASKVKIR